MRIQTNAKSCLVGKSVNLIHASCKFSQINSGKAPKVKIEIQSALRVVRKNPLTVGNQASKQLSQDLLRCYAGFFLLSA